MLNELIQERGEIARRIVDNSLNVNKDKVLTKLIDRKNDCEELILLVKDKECKAQLYGEKFGLEYAIGLLLLEEK